jgi:hypothetical protein
LGAVETLLKSRQKIEADEFIPVKRNSVAENMTYQARDAPKGMMGARNPEFINLLEHP